MYLTMDENDTAAA